MNAGSPLVLREVESATPRIATARFSRGVWWIASLFLTFLAVGATASAATDPVMNQVFTTGGVTSYVLPNGFKVNL
jgi:hypothetical protein